MQIYCAATVLLSDGGGLNARDAVIVSRRERIVPKILRASKQYMQMQKGVGGMRCCRQKSNCSREAESFF